MCLIAFAWKAHTDFRLIVAANRDELHRRPTQSARWWADQPDVFAGRDLQAGGTWLAMTRGGHFATVTNYRENQRQRSGLNSRGELVTSFVTGKDSPERFVAALDGDRYAGFSLLAADADNIAYVSNRGDTPELLQPGVYGLSNASLDTPWSKLVRTRTALQALIEDGRVNEAKLLGLLGDRKPAPVAEVHTDGLPFDLARRFTAPFIVSGDYGTRSSTVLMWGNDGKVSFRERSFDAAGDTTGNSSITFHVEQ